MHCDTYEEISNEMKSMLFKCDWHICIGQDKVHCDTYEEISNVVRDEEHF